MSSASVKVSASATVTTSSTTFGLPTFSEIGKKARELFDKGFHIGKVCGLDKNHPIVHPEVDYTVSLFHHADDPSYITDFSLKGEYKNLNLETNTKYTSAQDITQDVIWKNFGREGTKFGAMFRFNMNTNVKGVSVFGQGKGENATLDLSLDGGDDANVGLTGGVVTGMNGFLAGATARLDTIEVACDTATVALAYDQGDSAFVGLQYDLIKGPDSLQVTGMLKAHPQFDLGLRLGTAITPEMAIRYEVAPEMSYVRAKFNGEYELTLGYEVAPMPDLHVSLSGELNMRDFSTGLNKLGLSLELR